MSKVQILSYVQTYNTLTVLKDGQKLEYNGISPFLYEKLNRLISRKSWNAAERLLNSWKHASSMIAMDALKLAKDLIKPSFREAVMVLGSTTASAVDKAEAEKMVKDGLFGALKGGLGKAIKAVLVKSGEWGKHEIDMRKLTGAIWRRVVDEVSIRKMAKDIAATAMTKGWKFAILAVLLEIFEDIVLPGLAIYLGAPGLAPFFLALHLEPVVYPIALKVL